VTQDNAGKKTAGIDGLKSLSPDQRLSLAQRLKSGWGKAAPMRRVWIPKPGNREELRPLHIPTLEDRARQTLFKLALEPQWEAKFEPNSFGFRPGRSCHDAIMAIYLQVCHQPKWILDADLAKCFDTIARQPLLKKLNASPFVTRQIRAWLRAGVMDHFQYCETPQGVPQGGSLSPLLANVALHGMEKYIARYCKGARVIRYADDLLVIHPERQVIEHAQQLLGKWLEKMGLAFKPSKTRICHTLNPVDGQIGFDFLGFSIRQYRMSKYKSGRSMKGHKTLIQPSKAAMQRHLQRLQEVIRSHKAAPQAALIHHLNPIMRGWSAYFSAQCSKAAYSKLDYMLYQKLRAWAHRRHPNKSEYWRASRYWLVNQGGGWIFAAKRGESRVQLRTHVETPIVRHIKVQGNRSPFDGDWIYWATRMGKHPELPLQIAKLLKHQRGQCSYCKLYFKSEDLMEVHHVDRNHQNHKWENLTLLHQHCHDQVHSGVHDKHPVVEEPCEATSLKHGFADQRSG
jgi:RNA-directed DNA polymerase